MARFRNSNRHAAAQMDHAATRQRRKSAKDLRDAGYFRRIGFDFAMI